MEPGLSRHWIRVVSGRPIRWDDPIDLVDVPESSVRNDSLRRGEHTLLRTRVEEGGAHGVDQSVSAAASASAASASAAPASPASSASSAPASSAPASSAPAARDESLRYDVGGVVDRHSRRPT